MSKNIIIEQDGVAQSLNNVARLRPKAPTGGSVYFFPEDETTLAEVEITANGTYTPPAGSYGVSKATINVTANQTCGTGDGGQYYKVTVANNEFVYTEVPKSITVTTPPTQTAYADNEAIDYSGMVVTMRRGDGTVYTDSTYPDGIVPSAQITKPTTLARYGMKAVTVLWLCPLSGLVLEASFAIEVSDNE